MTRAFVVFSEKMGLKRLIRISQNQTSGLLQLILYKRHGKVVGDTLSFERLTQGVTEEAYALGYDLSVRYFYGSQPTDEQICAIQSEPCEALLRFGYRIPQDVSVIGFDDSSISTTRTPPLTTMQVQKQRLGALAVNRLHTRLQKNVPETLREALVPEVLVRESVLDRRNPPDRSTCW